MNPQRLIGIALFVVGALSVYFGYQGATADFGARQMEGYIDTSKWFMFGGAAAAVAGCLLAVFAKTGQASAR